MLRVLQRSLHIHNKCLISNILFKDVPSLKFAAVCQNNVFRHFASKIKNENELEQVYSGPLASQIRAVKLFSLSLSIAGLIAQPITIREAATIGSTSFLVAIYSVVGFFSFVTPILLHFITKQYVTVLHYDSKTSTYTATTINFFVVSTKLEFKVQDVTVPDAPGMFTTILAKGKPLFLEARHFSNPIHYAKIMGYDKPMHLKLRNLEEGDQQSSK